MPFLFFIFAVVPIIEIYLLVSVGKVIGPWPTIGIVIAMGLLGATMIKSQGIRLLSQVQLATARGQMPTNALINGLMVFLGGLMLITPGFITDVLGLAMIFPPTQSILRIAVKAYLMRMMAKGAIHVVTYTSTPPPVRDVTPQSPIQIDVSDREE